VNIVNLSGGKDSTALLLMMLERGIPVHKVLFADVGEMAEFSAMYEYLLRVEKYTGIPIQTVRSEIHTARNVFYGYPSRGKYKDEIRGFPPTIGPGCRYRSWLKVEPLEKASGSGNHVFIGIAADEANRSRSLEYAKGKNKYHFPLVEWGVTESECMRYLHNRDLYNTLYDYFHRLGCFWCPKQSISSLRSLYRHFPYYWQQLRQLETDQKRPFRYGYSAADLETRFCKEERKSNCMAA
jgi:3'-phosphoadenosine 5'-phosphosulfate sulfotransferase (PAPS reductase)/FAD synthetase